MNHACDRTVHQYGVMQQLHEIRAMNESLGDLTDHINPEFFDTYPVDVSQHPADAYGRRALSDLTITDVDGRPLITAGRPNSGMELLYAAHAEMAAVVAVYSMRPEGTPSRMESFWVSRFGITRSRFATLPESEDGILWLSPFEDLVTEVFAVAQLEDSSFVPDGLRIPVKRDNVAPHRPRSTIFAAAADAVRKVWPEAASHLDAGRGRELRLRITMVNADGLHEHERSWITTPVGALIPVFEQPRLFRPDAFITAMSLYELRREIEALLPGESDRRDWEALAVETAGVRIDTTIPS